MITPAKRRSAASLVTEGRSIALGQTPGAGEGLAVELVDLGEESAWSCRDRQIIDTHAPGLTHLDSLGHVFLNGEIYNRREVSATVTSSGLNFGDVRALIEGVFTRGILLDVCAVRDVPWLEPGQRIHYSDLIDAEQLAGEAVRAGDAVFIHSGREARERALGPDSSPARAGLAADSIAWLSERDIAVYSGDCYEALPSGYPRYPLPLHMIGLAAMGLVILDNPRLTELLQACRELGRSSFLFTCAPVPVRGSTGSPVNPLAIF